MKTLSVLHKTSRDVTSPTVSITHIQLCKTLPASFTHRKVTLLLLQTKGPFAWEVSCFWELPVNSMLMRLDGSKVFHQQLMVKAEAVTCSSSKQLFFHWSISVSHWFHFSRYEIFMPSSSLCPPLLMFRE